TARGPDTGGRVDAGEHGHPERKRLAGARAGTPAEVDPAESHGDGLGLDGERGVEPGGGETGIDFGGNTERREPGGGVNFV
ncbi:MAG: hypothetical protein RJB57_1210, partial [Actinomycetota bacterium]